MSKTLGSSPAHPFIAFLTFFAIAFSTTTQTRGEGLLVPDSQAFRAGLKVQWNAQLPVGGPYKLLDWCLHIDANSSTTYFLMEAGNIREVVSNRQLNSKGEPYGLQGAQEEIDFRKELLETRLKLRGVTDVEVKVSSYTLPKSVLYTLSSEGVVTAVDADTGNLLWDQLIGDIKLDVLGVGASNEHVAVVVGSKVYCLNAQDGRTLWSKETVYVPSAPPAVSDTNILVPLGNGRLQSFLIKDRGYGSNAFFASGFATARPLVTGARVVWTTDSGQLNLANPMASKAVSFRLKASDAIVAAPTARGNLVYTASIDGFVYCVDQEKGRLIWEVTTGAGVSQPVVPIGEFLYVVSDAEQLFKIDAATGQFSNNWNAPLDNIKAFLGASEGTIFALDTQNNLLVIDQNTGKTISAVDVGIIDRILTNTQTDRIYLASDDGLVQCVRASSSERPIFHNSDVLLASGSGTKPAGSATKNDPFATRRSTKKKSFATRGTNPFATESESPFATESENPFATEEKPQPDDIDDEDGNPFN